MSDSLTVAQPAWVPEAIGFHSEHSTPDVHRGALGEWEAFCALPPPVVTLLGGYDSGKSALVRRLVVDAGLACPDWLSISARHETFDLGLVQVGEILIRDTPGISADADDPRSAANNGRALAAAGLTDALLVVLPPQLATAEIEMIRRVAALRWPTGALRFAVCRFDEAGVDPTGDLAAYQDLAQRKVDELRASLFLASDVPVAVVAADAFQFAGDDTQPDPAIWDGFRGWDGMAELASDVLSIAGQRQDLRTWAARRYWTTRVDGVVERLTSKVDELLSTVATQQQEKRRLGQLRDRLSELRRTSQTDLDRIVGEVLNQSLIAGLADSDRLAERMRKAVDDWFTRSDAKLSEFVRDAARQLQEQMNRPNWADIEALLSSLSRASGDDDPASESAGSSTDPGDALRRINITLKAALQDVKTVFLKRTSDFSANADKKAATSSSTSTAAQNLPGRAGKIITAGEVVLALSPVFIEAANLISASQREAAQVKAERDRLDRIEKAVEDLGKQVANKAIASFETAANEVDAGLAEAAEAVVRAEAAATSKIDYVESAQVAATALLARMSAA